MPLLYGFGLSTLLLANLVGLAIVAAVAGRTLIR